MKLVVPARIRRMSFRARLGTFIALAVGLTVALAAAVSYFTVRNQLLTQVDNSLRSTYQVGAEVDDSQIDSIQGTNGGFVQVLQAYYGQVTVVGSTLPPSQWANPTAAEDAVVNEPGHYVIETVTYQGESYRVITQYDYYLGFPSALQIARPLTDVNHTLSTLGLILWLVTLGGIALAVGLGYLIGRETLRPVAKLTAAAEYVAATQDLDAPIEVQSEDELGRLARSFNAMLSAVAQSRQQQAQLISDAGHELRTPLTSLRTNIELLMRRPDMPAADRTELFADVEAQLTELTQLIGDLVELARQEEIQPEAIEVRLDVIVASAVERARRRAPSGLTFDVHLTAGSVTAQPPLLERAVLNVLDNAVKWSPPGGVVEVWLQRGPVWALDIRDHGPGIAAEDLPYVFDRFYRATTARSMPGSGLGLAIVAQVVTSHGGTVRAWLPPDGGTAIHIELPVVAEVEDERQGVGPVGGSAPDGGSVGESSVPGGGSVAESSVAESSVPGGGPVGELAVPDGGSAPVGASEPGGRPSPDRGPVGRADQVPLRS